MSTSKVALQRKESLTILRLADTTNANALTMAMKEVLLPHVADFFRDPGQRCLIITGEGRSFCAGGDLATLRNGQSAPETYERLASTHELIRMLVLGEKPVIMAVNGAAAGGGFGLAMLGDIILASENARFRPAFPAIGVAADVALSLTLPRAIGAVRARHILLNDITVGAREAEEMGMISAIFPAEELMEQAIMLGQKLAKGPTQAFGFTKRLLHLSYELPLDAFLNAEFAAQAVCFGSDDCREGVGAFYEKRQPFFKGQ